MLALERSRSRVSRLRLARYTALLGGARSTLLCVRLGRTRDDYSCTGWFGFRNLLAHELPCYVDCFLTPGDHSERAERTQGTQVGVLMVAQALFT